jgi:enoyl-CoA hydratase/carnithine racemase
VADLAANVSPRSMAVMKGQIYRGLSQPFDDACWAADEVMREALDHPDAKEGVASFVERRPPRFAPWTGS